MPTNCCWPTIPEVCFPIQALDGIANRANGQLYQGKRTQIGWTAKEVVLPTIAGSKASGAIIKVAGLTGRIRGMKFKRPDGKTVRPSLGCLGRPANRRIRSFAFAVCQPRSDPRRRGARTRRPRQKDLRHHALHRHSPRRHGRQHSRPRRTPGMERRTHANGRFVPDQRNALGTLRRDPQRRIPCRRWRSGRHRVLSSKSNRRWMPVRMSRGKNDSTTTNYRRSNTR